MIERYIQIYEKSCIEKKIYIEEKYTLEKYSIYKKKHLYRERFKAKLFIIILFFDFNFDILFIKY